MHHSDDLIAFDEILAATANSTPRPIPSTEQLDALLRQELQRLQQAAQQRQDPNP